MLAIRTPTPKYNPGFLTDDQLVASFCVREAELGLVVDMLRDCTGPSNAHQLVIGARGSGKTTLLLRVAAEVRRDPELESAFFPLVFAEESYGVSTAGEFWLEAMTRLADRVPARPDSPDLRASLGELRSVRDDAALEARCLGALLDFADREGKRLILIVENLHMMIGDMGDPDAEWRLREVLQTEPRIILIGSATSRFAEITDPGRALYEQFRIQPLDPLNDKECRILWEAESGRTASGRSIRPLQILTGGSPRLLAIIARFGARCSLRRLMRDLFDLVDDHTEYFKGHIEGLPAQERRVFLALAALWRPSTTREIADRARLDTNRCSAQLQRLMKRGAVRTAGGSPRRKRYVVTERLYNIYYLLRVQGDHASLVRGLVGFMRAFYSSAELEAMRSDLRRSDPKMRSLAKALLEQLEPRDDVSAREAKTLYNDGVEMVESGRHEDAITAWEKLIARFGRSEAAVIQKCVAAALDQLVAVLGERGRYKDALATADELLDRFGGNSAPEIALHVARGLVNRGMALVGLGRLPDAMAVWEDIAARFEGSDEPKVLGAVARAGVNRAEALRQLEGPMDALDALDAVVNQFGASNEVTVLRDVATGLVNKGNLLRELDRLDDAALAFGEVVRRFESFHDDELRAQVAKAQVNHGAVLASLERYAEALEAWDACASRYRDDDYSSELLGSAAKALSNQAIVLNGTGQWEEAVAVADDIARRFGDSAAQRGLVVRALIGKGVALVRMERTAEALAHFDELVRRYAESPHVQPHVLHARVHAAGLRLTRGERQMAVRAASRVLRQDPPEDVRQMALAVRARAAATDDPTAAVRDVRELLKGFAERNSPSRAGISMLVDLSVAVGSRRMLSLIEASRASEFLLPLSTALARVQGDAPRVSQEVSEVAEDLRGELEEARERARLSGAA